MSAYVSVLLTIVPYWLMSYPFTLVSHIYMYNRKSEIKVKTLSDLM
jgi:hypothetical protein